LGNHTYLYRSTNNGDNWQLTTFPLISVNSIAINGNIVYAGTQNNGVYISTNSGESWSQTSLTGQSVSSIVLAGDYVIAGSTAAGIFISYDNGASWVQKNEGLPNLGAGPLFVSGDYIYSGISGRGIWKRPLSEILALHHISSEIPGEYRLFQNYPNPFNPVTKIRFDIPSTGSDDDGHVLLSIFDISGRVVSTIVNQQLQPGSYEAEWDASQFASGIYFYRLTTNHYASSKKMVLVK
jgi:hypothetical protein